MDKFTILCAIVVLACTVAGTRQLEATVKTQSVKTQAGTAPGFKLPSVDSDIDELVKENLMRDLEYWKSKKLKMSDLEKLREHLNKRVQYVDCVRLILVYDNKIYFPYNSGMMKAELQQPANAHLHTVHTSLLAYTREFNITLPNVLFFLNVNDNVYRWCQPSNNCTAPLLSLIKYWDMNNETHRDTDILVPELMYKPPPLYFYPWDLKEDKAFFRGTPWCFNHGFTGCSRTYLAHLTYWHNANHTLDAGLTTGWGVQEPNELTGDYNVSYHGPMQKAAVVPLRDHSKYRYLLQLDGMTASYRLSQLMHCNSIIIKQQSNWIEYISRSLKEDVHYVSFWKKDQDDIFEVVGRLRNTSKTEPNKIQDMIAHSMHFGYRYTSMQSRILYWKRALQEYKSLFSDMDEHINSLVKGMRGQGISI